MTAVTVILGAISLIAILFVAMLLSTLIGGCAGWVVESVFPYVITTLNTLTGLSLTGFEMGAVLGFVGSFFKSSLTNNNKSDK
jgi:hypothetical protein